MRTCAANSDEMVFDNTVVARRESADAVALRTGELWTQADLRGRIRVACIRGDLWITRQGKQEDIVLRAGHARQLANRGKLVVQALTDAVFEVSNA